MTLKTILLAMLGSLLLASCGASGTHYEKSPQAVVAALKMATLPYHVLGDRAQGSRVSQPDANTVVTAVLGPDQSELIRFVATVAPDGAGSRVSVNVQPPEGKNHERATKAMAQNGLTMGLMNKLAQEHVAAAIEGRPFDMMFAAPPMAKGILAANPAIQAQIQDANSAAASMNQAMRDDRQDTGFADDSTSGEESDWGQ
jgi:hypothetical protein